MTKEFSAQRLDVKAFAQAGGRLSGHDSLLKYERLAQEAKGLHPDLMVEWEATGELRTALGGMVLPALLFLVFNLGGDGARGWGIPMATDIAFAPGVLALFGSRIPSGLKLLLLSVASWTTSGPFS